MNVQEFARQIQESKDLQFLQVRGVKLAESLQAHQLRTKKNDHRAVAWDELGNATVLTKAGQVRQLIGNEYQGA